MLKLVTLFLVSTIALSAITRAAQPSTQPSRPPTTTEIRALEEFNQGNWKLAMPLLKKAVQELNDQPMRQGAMQEAIRVCERNIASGASPSTQPGASATSSEKRVPHAPPQPGKVMEMSIKDLANFDYDADHGGVIPDDVKRLNGSTLRLRGFMIPMDQAQNVTEFALVPSLFSCCYGQPPQVQHTIIVHAPKGVAYDGDEILVEGKLIVDEKKEDGFTISLFELDCNSVKPTAR